MPRLLVVEDDLRLRRSLAISLTARRFTVDEAAGGVEALASSESRPPDLVLLDLGLPDLDGLALIGRIRQSSQVPIIVLSARNQQSEKVDALEAGADDYVTKPFGLEELVARIRVALRRSATTHPTIVTGSFTLDFGARRAVRKDVEVRLTPTEWLLAEALASRARTVVPAERLLHEVWGPAAASQTHYLRIYLGHLRHKLEDDPAHPVHFVTVARVGYRFEP